jgi:hypothetical protein
MDLLNLARYGRPDSVKDGVMMPTTLYRGVPRDTITGRHGNEVDITEQIGSLLDIADSGDFQTQYKVDFIKKLGRKLVAAGGCDAPARIIEDYAADMPQAFVGFLRDAWNDIATECD